MLSSPDRTELSESYFHLSSDHSSFDSDDGSARSPEASISSQLLSRARDMDRLFATQSPQHLKSPYHGNDITYPEASFSSHSTPLNIEPRTKPDYETYQKKTNPKTHMETEAMESPETATKSRSGFRPAKAGAGLENQTGNRPVKRSTRRSRHPRADPKDLVHQLVSHFEDALGECIQEFRRGSDSMSDSADDTFEQSHAELLSPLSSPQSSRDYEQKMHLQQESPSDQSKRFEPESLHLEQETLPEAEKFEPVSTTSAPKISLEDLTSDHIDIQSKKDDVARPSSAEYIDQLEEKLRQYQQDNAELHNELQFARNQVHRQEEQRSQNLHQKDTKSGDSVTETSSIKLADLPDQFKPYYHKLHLEAVDQMSVEEMRRMIKNVMLSLLISDFEHLPTMIPKIGKYISLTTEFLDSLHGSLYDSHMKPSEYLRDYGLSLDGLSECLEGMSAQYRPASSGSAFV